MNFDSTIASPHARNSAGLEESLRMKELAIDASITGFAFGTLEGEITYANPAFVEMFGYDDASEIVGRPNADFASDASLISEIMAGVRSQGYWRGEDLARKKDGTPFPVEVAVSRMSDSENRPFGLVATFIDLTARKAIEAALRKSEEQIRAILDTASDAIVTLDENGTITGVNQATEQIFGYPAPELLGQGMTTLVPMAALPPCDRQESDDNPEPEFGPIPGSGHEAIARRKDGSTFPIDLAVSEVDGLGLYTGIIRDLSRRRHLEHEVYKASEEERIRIARDLHDSLGSLLTGIGYLASAMSGKLQRGQPVTSKEVDAILQNIHDAISQTRTLAHGLHRVSEDPDALPVALNDLAERTRSTSKLRCRFVGPRRDVTISDSVTANHLFRIAQEAVNNAVRHAEASHLTIRLDRKNDGHLALSIKDNGRGFDPEQSRSEGLGLHTMQYRARAIGAQLTIRRRKKHGTAVMCVLEAGG